MKILSYQPFSLCSNGGGSRILRRLFTGNEANVHSLTTAEVQLNPCEGNIKETVVYAAPIMRSWMRWKLRNIARWLREGWFRAATEKKVQAAARNIKYDVLHVVDHGPYAAALCHPEFYQGKELWVSFHDHFSTSRSFAENSRRLWENASRRLVISEEMGQEYSRLFGFGDYEIITDGVYPEELSEARSTPAGPVYSVYFAGLLHLHYMPLFAKMADALDELYSEGFRFQLILRATQHLDFLDNRKFETSYLPMTLDSALLKRELDEADILYLPIKFTTPDFYRYSLSTKMVGYLGAPGAILYHGPLDSAACHMLQNAGAAACCGTLTVADVKAAIKLTLADSKAFSARAKVLAQEKFNLADIQRRFWQQVAQEH